MSFTFVQPPKLKNREFVRIKKKFQAILNQLRQKKTGAKGAKKVKLGERNENIELFINIPIELQNEIISYFPLAQQIKLRTLSKEIFNLIYYNLRNAKITDYDIRYFLNKYEGKEWDENSTFTFYTLAKIEVDKVGKKYENQTGLQKLFMYCILRKFDRTFKMILPVLKNCAFDYNIAYHFASLMNLILIGETFRNRIQEQRVEMKKMLREAENKKPYDMNNYKLLFDNITIKLVRIRRFREENLLPGTEPENLVKEISVLFKALRELDMETITRDFGDYFIPMEYEEPINDALDLLIKLLLFGYESIAIQYLMDNKSIIEHNDILTIVYMILWICLEDRPRFYRFFKIYFDIVKNWDYIDEDINFNNMDNYINVILPQFILDIDELKGEVAKPKALMYIERITWKKKKRKPKSKKRKQ